MAVRSRVLLPDVAVQTVRGDMAIVSREQMLNAVADAVALQEMAGGFFNVAVQREPTGLPNEMVTVRAMVTWQDRTDAKPQPEGDGLTLPAMATEAPLLTAEQWAAAQDIQDAAVAEQPQEDANDYEAEQAAAEDAVREGYDAASPDGLDYSQLEDEDLTEVPERA